MAANNPSHAGHAYQGEDCPTCRIERAIADSFAAVHAFGDARRALCRALARRKGVPIPHDEWIAKAISVLVSAERNMVGDASAHAAMAQALGVPSLSKGERQLVVVAMRLCERDMEATRRDR